jgi:hypothetical protein
MSDQLTCQRIIHVDNYKIADSILHYPVTAICGNPAVHIIVCPNRQIQICEECFQRIAGVR